MQFRHLLTYPKKMDQNEQHFQSLGICHRLFYFFMRTLAAQALKPVTLGPTVSGHQDRKTNWSGLSQLETRSPNVNSIIGGEDSESIASIDIEDEAFRLLGTEEGGWWYDQGRVGKPKAKAPGKMVRINDEPEIITKSKKRKDGVMERRHDGELRPLRSILKVGSNLSAQTFNVNP